MSNPLLQLLGSVASKEGLLKEVMYRIQEGSPLEVINNIVFFALDSSVLSPFDWIYPKPTSLFVVAKVKLIDDIMKVKGQKTATTDEMHSFLKELLFPKISHINTTNQPFPNIYSDEKKTILNTSVLSPLTYEYGLYVITIV
ncbi:hypothetical protein WA171_002742 [Blastocystis sp. BT1]